MEGEYGIIGGEGATYILTPAAKSLYGAIF